jgi:hypothetical protein
MANSVNVQQEIINAASKGDPMGVKNWVNSAMMLRVRPELEKLKTETLTALGNRITKTAIETVSP